MKPRDPEKEALALTKDKVDVLVSDFGTFLGKRSERLVIRKGKEAQAEIPFFKIDQVIVLSTGVSLSADVIRECAEAGIPIYFLSYSGKPYATISSATLIGTVATRREQLAAYSDGRGVHLAKCFARGKVRNQAVFLKYLGKYRKSKDLERYRILEEATKALTEIDAEIAATAADAPDDIRTQLLNLEARAATLYWEAVKDSLLVEVGFESRDKRGATDLVNSCLNYGYGVLYTQIEAALVLAGLDPYGGFLHADRSGRPSLVMDLIEEFRQPVVDRTIFGLLNLGTKLEVEEGKLTDATRKLVAQRVLDRLDAQEPYQGKKHRLRTIIQSQARHIATFVRGEGGYDPFVGSW